MKFKKKAIEVDVTFAKQAGKLVTLEGEITYQVGDAILTGITNERWPIARSRFEVTYQPIPQIRMGFDGKYFKRPISVDATQSTEITLISLNNSRGVLTANVGDWIITEDSGEQWVVADEIFLKTYEPI